MIYTAAELHRTLVGERNNIIIPRVYLQMTGGEYPAAILLAEVVYWSADWADTAEQDGWFWRTYDEWEARYFLSRKQISRALGILNGLLPGRTLVHHKVSKPRLKDGSIMNTTATFYKLDRETYQEMIERYMGEVRGTSRKLPQGTSGKLPQGTSLTSSTPDTPPETTQKGMRVGKETDEFAAFYDAYPRKKARADAWRAWRTLKPDPALIETIMAALAEQIRVNWHDTDPRYIPYPASWIRAERWKDEIEAPRPKPAANRVVADHAETDRVDWFGKYGGQQ